MGSKFIEDASIDEFHFNKYNIIIEFNKDKYLIVNSLTRASDILDDETYNLISLWNETNFRSREKNEDVFNYFRKRGYITNKSDDIKLDERVKHLFNICEENYRISKRFTIIPTYDCNLRCVYCFEKDLWKKGKKWREKVLNKEQVNKIFLIMEKIRSQNEGVLYLYGGEPLLLKNKDIILYILEKATNLGYFITIVTNGIELKEYLPLIKGYNIKNIQITLDGIKEIHDKRRINPHGEGSFDQIVESIRRVKNHHMKTTIRMNLDAESIQYLKEFYDFLKKEDFIISNDTLLNISPVRFDKSKWSSNITFDEFFHRLLSIKGHKEYVWSSIQQYASFLYFLDPRSSKAASLPQFHHCRAEGSLITFDPHGDIYSCWTTIGEPTYRIGRYMPELKFNEAYNLWAKRSVFSIAECRECKYFLLCDGGCGYLAYEQHGSIMKSNCDQFISSMKYIVPYYLEGIFGGEKAKNWEKDGIDENPLYDDPS
jgi:uncharacterized protein